MTAAIEPGDSCTICFEEFQFGEPLAYHDPKHPFHIDCLKKWAWKKDTCPVCRGRVNMGQLFTPIEKAQRANFLESKANCRFSFLTGKSRRETTFCS